MNAEELVRALGGRRFGRPWLARCPTSDGRTPMLSIGDPDDGTVLVRCHAGCSPIAPGAPSRPLNRTQQEERPAGRSKPEVLHMDIKPKPPLQAVQPSDPGPGVLDPFDPANLRLNQSFAETTPVKKLLRTVPVRKPSAQDFVRVHPAPEYRDNFPIVELKGEREEYIVTAGLVPELAGEFVNKTLFLAINRQATPFFWPIRLPASDGRDLEWFRSAREAAEQATKCWVRVRANMDVGAYDIYVAEGAIPDPEWPELDFWELIKIAFRDHLIDRVDHPVIKRLRGLA
jgi:hypothetical protein